MKWKTIFLLSLLILTQKTSYAFKEVTYDPIVKYNSSKTHYLASLPRNENSIEGFTAVFDSKTHKLKFKVQTYFFNKRVFLSADGNQLIHVNSKEDSLGEHFFLSIIDQYNNSRTLKLFDKKPRISFTPWSDHIHDLYMQKSHLVIVTSDSTYKVNVESSTTFHIKNNSDNLGDPNKRFKSEFLNNDSVFSITNLKINGVKLIDKLLSDLNLKEATREEYEQAGYLYSITFETILNKKGEFDNLLIIVRRTSNFGLEENQRSSSELKTKVQDLIESYDLKQIIPEGVDYWYYSGDYIVI